VLRFAQILRLHIFSCCLLVSAVAGCGQHSSTPVPETPDSPGSLNAGPVVEGLSGALPPPVSLINQLRGVSYAEADLVRAGGKYELSFPHDHVANSSNYLWLNPIAQPGQTPSLDNLAYALYAFTLSSYDQAAVLDMDWIEQPLVSGDVYVGLSNFSKNAWDWFPAPVSSQLTLASFADYIHAGDETMFVVVAMSGSSTAIMNHIRVGRDYSEFEDNEVNSLNLLPESDYSNYTASLGTDGSYPGYDGDTVDDYAFYARRGDSVSISITYDSGNAALTAELTDMFGNVLANVSGASPLQLNRTFGQLELAPYHLNLEATSGFTDYTISCDYNYAPEPLFHTDVWSGSAPLVVNLDASASSDADGSITKYEWDWDGDGTFDFDSGIDPTVQHVFPADGVFRPTLQVTDDTAHVASNALTISVGSVSYDEVEPNDALYNLPLLPSFPFAAYRGSIGAGLGYPGYDGDDQDGYFFYPAANQKVTFTLNFDAATAPGITMMVADGYILDTLESSLVAPGQLCVSLTAPSGSRKPYLLVVSVTSGQYSDYTLQAGNGQAPTVLLDTDTTAGLAPLDVQFDASASFDDGTITTYEWDWDNDYVFDQNSGSVAHAVHNFGSAGDYPVHVRVTDNEGLMSTASTTVYAWPVAYDEVEPNSYSSGELAYVPSLPFTGFSGSIGSGPGYAGYAGDNNDTFIFDAEVGDTVSFTVTSDNSTADMYLVLRDGDGSYEWDQSNTDTGTETVSHVMTGAEVLPMIIWVSVSSGGYTNYELSGSKS
jgi:hypothetical protein